jgi:uncharacterized phiE125 gp8 family phage protein
MTNLVLVTPPAVEPLTPAEVRERLGLPASVTDSLLDTLIMVARQEIDGPYGLLNGRTLIDQTWELLLDEFPEEGSVTGLTGAIEIPLRPLLEVIGINHLDPATGLPVTVPPTDYFVDLPAGWIVPAGSTAWPVPATRPNAVIVRFRAGYGGQGSDVPEPLRQAIALKVGAHRVVAARPDPTLRSETVEGVGARSWDTGGAGGNASVQQSIDAMISRYRIPFA